MLANLEIAASRLFPKPKFEMIYFEAIANALDANATEIDININFNKSKFSNFTIKDNGDGFNNKNYDLFSRLLDVKDKSHKGQGRLIYLLYFKKIKFSSTFYDCNKVKHRSFDFDFSFEKSKGDFSENSSGNTGTLLTFEEYSKEKIRDFNYIKSEWIREKVLSEFLPVFYQMKLDEKKFHIRISTEIDGRLTQSKISADDIYNFEKIKIEKDEIKKFSPRIQAELENLFRIPLTLYYYIKEPSVESSIVTSFAIDNRAISLSIIDRENYLENIEAVFFLASPAFEGMVDSTRQELTLPTSELKIIKEIFKTKIQEIFTKKFDSYKEEIENRREILENKFPHLKGYIDEGDIGFSSHKDLILSAQKKFFDDQRNILEKDHLDEKDYQKSLDLCARNLTEYILFRQIQIEKMKLFTESNKENEIHNIISPAREIVKSNEDKNIFRNNAWILDDRFMSFIHSASDVSLKRITQEFDSIFNKTSSSKERPDYLMFFSNYLREEYDKVDLVCFEFKRLGISTRDKISPVTQLTDSIGELKDKCKKIERVWLYALVDFDNEFESALKRQDFKMKFSVQGKIWYRYFENISSELAFLDFKALLHDADCRNKTFMEILKKGF